MLYFLVNRILWHFGWFLRYHQLIFPEGAWFFFLAMKGGGKIIWIDLFPLAKLGTESRGGLRTAYVALFWKTQKRSSSSCFRKHFVLFSDHNLVSILVEIEI